MAINERQQVLSKCAEWCDAQAKSDWYGRTAADMVRAFAALEAARPTALTEDEQGLLAYKSVMPQKAQMAIEAATAAVWREFVAHGFTGYDGDTPGDELGRLMAAVTRFFIAAQGAA